MKRIELLSPAKDLSIGKAAIDNGADAVYIGAAMFGARKAAGNSLKDIAALAEYAHRFYGRVFVTLNTVLYDPELPEAERLIKQLYAVGVDALIVQDPGILKLDLPPISLHASTQMHNYEPERIRFLDRLGFQRIVLARELSLEQIRVIRREIKAELEVFVHGALCVSLSGQCYLSHYLSGRSANRGECAQPCRMKWSVEDQEGRVVVKDKYVLSLKDLNLSSYIPALIEAGVDSFKIEGRLKDESYVANVTNYYHTLINNCLKGQQQAGRVGSGVVNSRFVADPERSFNRGYTSYFMEGRSQGLANMVTPKSMGKWIGKVTESRGKFLTVDPVETLANGDGLCYVDKGELRGLRVNAVTGNQLVLNESVTLPKDTLLYRNYDRCFVNQLEKEKSVRKIRIKITASEEQEHLCLTGTDEDENTVNCRSKEVFEEAVNPVQEERIRQQLGKCGDTDFVCEEVEYKGKVLFIPSAVLNGLKRDLLTALSAEREKNRERMVIGKWQAEPMKKERADWRYNVVNAKAAAFYQEHGVREIEEGFELKNEVRGYELMRTRYCLLYELGYCRKLQKTENWKFPLYLYNEKHRFRLEFDCQNCFMKVRAEE